MFRTICLFLCLCVGIASLSACSRKTDDAIDDVTTSIYSTFYPLYAATEWLVDGVSDVRANLLVQPQDGCIRSYQLSDWDLALLSSADLIVSGGRGLESFESVLYSLGESGPVVSSVLYNMDLDVQRGVNTKEDTESHWLDENPHIYMSIDGMDEIVQRICSTLILRDAENEDLYRSNLSKIQIELEKLQSEILTETASLKDKKVIVMNEALIYAAKAYGLEADLFYERESGADLVDADLDQCLKVIQKTDARVILLEKQAPQALCEALEDAGYSLARLDILSTRDASDGAKGYFEAQRANIQVVRTAFESLSNESGE